MPHPEFSNTLDAAGEIHELSAAAGVLEAMAHLAAVRDKAAGEGASDRWLEGFDEGVSNVEDAVPWFAHEEFMNRDSALPNTQYDPAELLAALAGIYTHGLRVGHSNAIEAARAQRDTETVPEAEHYISDPDDPDEAEVEEYQGQADYVAGLLAVATCLVEQFPDADPDPGWEPA